jgi:hypothetical protein
MYSPAVLLDCPLYFLVVKSISFSVLSYVADTGLSADFSHVHASKHICQPIESLVHSKYTQPHRMICIQRPGHLPAGRAPQAQLSPATLLFSVAARSHVHSPAGRARHEQRGPVTAFSVADLSQSQASADCLPHEHFAC